MILLGIDTSLGACSVAVFDSVKYSVVASEMRVMERGHAEMIGLMAERVMTSANLTPKDIGRIVVTRGPGTFTGLRIGLSFAKGVALARGIPLLGIDTLLATAAPHLSGSANVVVAHKAGATGKFYVGCFDATGRTLREPALLSSDALRNLIADIGQARVIGSGLADTPDTWPDAAKFLPHAAALPDDAESGEPLYLRAPDAKPLALQGKTVPALRLAHATDADVLSDVHGKCFEKQWTAEMLRQTLTSASGTTLLIENAGVACGFIQAQAAAGEAEILTFCVLPMLRRHGLALVLLGGLIADLKMRGVKKLFLEVAESNGAAIGLYRRANFQEIGRRKAYYANGADAITMALVL